MTVPIGPKKAVKAPSITALKRWGADGYCKATDGCRVEPEGTCAHGKKSWLLILGLV